MKGVSCIAVILALWFLLVLPSAVMRLVSSHGVREFNNEPTAITRFNLPKVLQQCQPVDDSNAASLFDVFPWNEVTNDADGKKFQARQCTATLRVLSDWRVRSLFRRNAPDELLFDELRERPPVVKWPGFSPTKEDLRQTEIDLRQHLAHNRQFWDDVFATSHQASPALFTAMQVRLNAMHFVVNPQFTPKEGHLPIVCRSYQRDWPLREVLRGTCQNVDGINESHFILSIDGDNFKPVLQALLDEMTCAKTHVFWHPFESDRANFDISQEKSTVLNAHFAYTLYLAIHQFGYPYVITLEDDLLPTRDFYYYHLSLWTHTLHPEEKANLVAIATLAHGPVHDCKYIREKYVHRGGPCMMSHRHMLLREPYFAGRGSGIPQSTAYDFLYIWHRTSTYWDGLLTFYIWSRPNHYSLVPCMGRAITIRNKGQNGWGFSAWNEHVNTSLGWNLASSNAPLSDPSVTPRDYCLIDSYFNDRFFTTMNRVPHVNHPTFPFWDGGGFVANGGAT